MPWGNTTSHVLPQKTGKDVDNTDKPRLHGVPGKNKGSESCIGIDKCKDVL